MSIARSRCRSENRFDQDGAQPAQLDWFLAGAIKIAASESSSCC
jgi:hypothetical protein